MLVNQAEAHRGLKHATDAERSAASARAALDALRARSPKSGHLVGLAGRLENLRSGR